MTLVDFTTTLAGPSRVDSRGAVERYALHGEIAAGGMATVHLARLHGPVGFGRTVAIKRLHPHHARDPEFVNMFLDEAKLAASIHHPHVVPTLDVVAHDAELFLVMEYVHGESLAALLRTLSDRDERIDLAILLDIVVGALHGLHAAHEARGSDDQPLGIVHRDVSPQNIMVGVDGIARVVDFGIAKAISRLQSTRDGQLKGKLRYMSPERLSHEVVDRRTDVYAMTVVLWEALASRPLFAGDEPAALMCNILTSPVARLGDLVPGIPPGLDAIVLRGLARSPDDRFATALEMAEALEKVGLPASRRTVGAWVATTAGAALAARAAKLLDIEQRSAVVARHGLPAPSEATTSLDSATQRDPLGDPILWLPEGVGGEDGLVTQEARATAGRGDVPNRWRRALLATGMAIAVVVVAWLLFSFSRAGAPPVVDHVRVGSAPSDPDRDATAAGPSADLPAIEATSAAPDPVPLSATSSTPPVVAPASSVRPRGGPSGHPPPRKPALRRPGCDPPYTTDAQGTKIYKPQCL